ncbi:MAG: hypothetical protein JWR35_1195 [Marmoricola sp.]|nr:hypothetical protein [Marmoricola sp.]
MTNVDDLTCPKCQGAMAVRSYADVPVRQCGSCQGLFLDQADLGALIEAENDWHSHKASHTNPMPRITADMTAPPPMPPSSRAFIESLFTG